METWGLLLKYYIHALYILKFTCSNCVFSLLLNTVCILTCQFLYTVDEQTVESRQKIISNFVSSNPLIQPKVYIPYPLYFSFYM